MAVFPNLLAVPGIAGNAVETRVNFVRFMNSVVRSRLSKATGSSRRIAGSTRISAVPAGGAPKGGRDRTPSSLKLCCGASAAALALMPAMAPAQADLGEEITLPSGRAAEFQELRLDVGQGGGALYRFRFVVNALAETVGALETVTADLEWLCNDVALPVLPTEMPDPEALVISMSASPTPFGVAAPEVTQVFEAFSVNGDACILEPF